MGNPGQTYPALIDPLYPDLMKNLASIFGAMNDVFPPAYPFHIGGDEVERGLFNNCSNAIAFAAAHNVTGDISTYVTAWFERSLYEMLIRPPFSRRVMAWSDVGAGLVDETWTNVSTNLILEQWDGAPGVGLLMAPAIKQFCAIFSPSLPPPSPPFFRFTGVELGRVR